MGVFHVYWNCTNGTKSRKASHIIFNVRMLPLIFSDHVPMLQENVTEESTTPHYFREFIFVKLTLPTPCISESCIEIKIKLNFYFHTSLRCLKTFWGTTKKCEKKKFNLFFSLRPGLGREGWQMTLRLMTNGESAEKHFPHSSQNPLCFLR